MNAIKEPRDSEVFVLGTTVVNVRTERRSGPPREGELIRDELRKAAERKAGRRRGVRDRLSSGLRQLQSTATRDQVGSRS